MTGHIPNAQTPPSPDPSKPWGSARNETPGEDQTVAHGQPNEQSARDGLVEACREAETLFRNYEQLHLAKGTQEGDEKAYRNKQMADKLAAALRTAQPNAAEPVATGSFACRICGEDTPHYHSPDEVREHDETERWVEESLRQFHQCEREYRAAHPSAAPSSQDAAKRADVRGLVEEIGCRLRQSGLLKDNRLAERLEAALSPTGEAQQGERQCAASPNGRHQVDTSMESGPNNCFHCEQPMPKRGEV